ncbi:MAG: hypothetical protein IKO40_11580 [Kiritimatiellae bacterium]|nr:hypothetical protein [Kiritimatiellia bacterium]
MTKSKLTRIATAMMAAAALAPAAFAEDAYIQSDGTQYIDTGYFHNCDTRVELDCELVNPVITTGDQYLFGTHGTASVNGNFCFSMYVKKNGMGLGWNCQTNVANYSTLTDMQISGDRKTFVIDACRGEVAVLAANGTTLYGDSIRTQYATGRSPYALRICTSRGAAGANTSLASLKIYGLKIYESGTIIHDYVPAVKGGEAGLYDTIGGGFHASAAATTSFASGGDIVTVDDDPYIESDGTAQTGVNSRYFYNAQSRIEIDFAFTALSPLQMRIFGADNSANVTRASFYLNNSSNASFGFNDSTNTAFLAHTTGLIADTNRHTIYIDQPNNKAHYITGGVTNKTVNIASRPANPSTMPLALFGTMSSASGLSFVGSNNSSKSRIYRARFWNGSELVHDYTPVVKGGTPGFRDSVDGAFVSDCPNALSASSNAPQIPDDGYICTTGANGNQYLDTGYTPNDTTRVELDYAFADDYVSGERYPFSAYKNGYFCIYLNSSAAGWGTGANRWKTFSPALNTASAFYAKNTRRTAVLDMENLANPASIVTAGFTNAVSSSVGATLKGSSAQADRLYIGAKNNNGLVSRTPLKIYGLNIYENGSSIRSYKPYVKDGVPGLFDAGNNSFLSAAIATNNLNITVGGLIDSDAASREAYIESYAVARHSIDTGYAVGPNTRIEFAFSLIGDKADGSQTADWYIIDNQQNSGTKQYVNFLAQYSSGKFVWCCGTTTWKTINTSATRASRYVASIDCHSKKVTLNGNGYSSGDISVDNPPTAALSGNTLRLFSRYNGESSWASARIYYCRIREYNDSTGEYDLIHEFLPYTDGMDIGFYDTVTGSVRTNVLNSATPLSIGGKGVEGEEKWVKALPATATVSSAQNATTLTAAAAGAKSYIWKCNDVVIPEVTGETCTATWRKGHYETPDTYTCTPVYDVFGVETEGEPVACEVTRIPDAFVITVR